MQSIVFFSKMTKLPKNRQKIHLVVLELKPPHYNDGPFLLLNKSQFMTCLTVNSSLQRMLRKNYMFLWTCSLANSNLLTWERMTNKVSFCIFYCEIRISHNNDVKPTLTPQRHFYSTSIPTSYEDSIWVSLIQFF